ncbi:MAG: hypothetical protein ACQEQG_09515, partial [Bacillota bacterium]
MNKDSYRNFWRTGVIMFIVSLMVFGMGYIGLANGPLVDPILGDDIPNLIQTSNENPNFPDPNAELLDRPDGYELMHFKIDGDQDSIFDGQTFYDNGFEVTIYKQEIDGKFYFGFESNYPVMHVYAKGGSSGGNLYSYYPEYPNGVTADSGLSQPGGDWSHISFYYTEGMEELTVSKTVETFFNREHSWDI